MNDQGLFYDWVAGQKTKWKHDKSKQTVENSCDLLMEQCATVDDAIKLYSKTNEEGFSYAKILVADARGASVIMGYRDGKFFADRMDSGLQVIGFGKQQVDSFLRTVGNTEDTPSISSDSLNTQRVAQALKSAMQKGRFSTQYSNICDLKNLKTWIYQFDESDTPIVLDLRSELSKGPHYYEIPKLAEQLNEPIRRMEDIKKSWWDRIF